MKSSVKSVFRAAFTVMLALCLTAQIFCTVSFAQKPETDASRFADPPSGFKVDAYDFDDYNNKGVVQVDEGAVCGMHVKLNAPFVGFMFCTPTWGRTDSSAVYSLYKWDSTYSRTVSGTPIASQRVTDIPDGAFCWLSFPEQQPGDYFVCLEDVTGIIGMWVYPSDVSKGIFYLNGVETAGEAWATFVFSEQSDSYFSKAASETDVDGEHTTPDPYVLPDDAAVYTHEVMPDTWVFTDGLGRVSLTYDDVGGPRDDKTVAMFYWTWFDRLNHLTPVNLTEFMKLHPEIKNDYYSPLWDTDSAYWWNESVYGFYRTSDPWVLRRQGELLANAMVDTVITDNTNGGVELTFRSGYRSLYEAWDKAQQDGVNVPKIGYMFAFSPTAGSREQMTSIYLDIYRTNEYPNLWFWWDGKPFFAAYTSHLNRSVPVEREILNFFTFRTPQPYYKIDSSKNALGYWGWLSMYPQPAYYKNTADYRSRTPEMTTVGVAANWDYVKDELSCMNGEHIAGRSYTSTGYHTEPGATRYGYFFAEQAGRALEIDPRLVFVTGWNEGWAGRHENLGVPNAFPDTFIDEYSRDIEPSKGDLKDHYYYQLVNFVRQYKGCRPIPTPTLSLSVDMNADLSQWDAVGPYFTAYGGNTFDRDAAAFAGTRYTETSGRNDLYGAKVARDENDLWFLIECVNDITPDTDALWMNLYLDTDRTNQGWETFDYVINRKGPGIIERFTGNGYETVEVGHADYTVNGRYLQIRVPKSVLNLPGSYDFTVNFTVTDNVHDEGDYTAFSGDIMDFYISGDVAPGGRFKYSYVSTYENATGETRGIETEADSETVDTPDTVAEAVTDSPVPDGINTQTGDVTDTDLPDSGTDASDTGDGQQESQGGCRSTSACLPLMLCAVALTGAVKKKKRQ